MLATLSKICPKFFVNLRQFIREETESNLVNNDFSFFDNKRSSAIDTTKYSTAITIIIIITISYEVCTISKVNSRLSAELDHVPNADNPKNGQKRTKIIMKMLFNNFYL